MATDQQATAQGEVDADVPVAVPEVLPTMTFSGALHVMAYLQQAVPERDDVERHRQLYLAQGWMLGLDGRPLFPERVEAWAEGPVVRDVHHAIARGRVPDYDGRLDDDAVTLIDAVLHLYRAVTASGLDEIVLADGPWVDARTEVDNHPALTATISQRTLRAAYGRRTIVGASAPVLIRRTEPADADDVDRVAGMLRNSWAPALDLLAES
ncbi:Panacea domain-containing protein [Curtobacterium sp. SP.BCp]|uniref:Panacea domain-containing protein n=1 Tax=Curtobacterium sp. SP.BCp TaxID=3435230 RepID=UPI003F73E157